MGTRSYIAVQTGKNSYRAVYCHWDGYLEHNGRILLESYNDRFKVENLLSYGRISSLDNHIGVKTNYEEPNKDQCVFHHRDMERDYDAPHEYRSLKIMLKDADDCGAEYVYIFTLDGSWIYADRGPQFFGQGDGLGFSEFKPLAPAVESALKQLEEKKTA